MNNSDQHLENEDLAEEIDAINAIYEPSTITLTSATSLSDTTSHNTSSNSTSQSSLPISTTIILQIPDHPHISFLLGFDAEYPSTPPRILGPASTGSRGEGRKWVDVLSDSAAEIWTPGSVCLYDLIVEAGERFDEIKSTQCDDEQEQVNTGKSTEAASATSGCGNGNEGGNAQSTGQSLLGSLGLDSPPDWIMSDPFSEKKSVFVARVASVQSKEQAEKYLDHLLATEKKVASATHNITAWRIRQRQQQKRPEGIANVNTVIQDFDDDGESAAGGRLLHLMQLMDVRDVVVVVTRWYGGVKLGPDRFRIINAAARDALVKGKFDKSESTNVPEKGKKKGKR